MPGHRRLRNQSVRSRQNDPWRKAALRLYGCTAESPQPVSTSAGRHKYQCIVYMIEGKKKGGPISRWSAAIKAINQALPPVTYGIGVCHPEEGPALFSTPRCRAANCRSQLAGDLCRSKASPASWLLQGSSPDQISIYKTTSYFCLMRAERERERERTPGFYPRISRLQCSQQLTGNHRVCWAAVADCVGALGTVTPA